MQNASITSGKVPPSAPVSDDGGASGIDPGRSLVQGFIALLASFVFGFPTLIEPFGRDQGSYAYSAWIWLDGGTLYRDVYVFKPPFASVVHALSQLLFGHSIGAIRTTDILWTAATAFVVARLATLLFHHRWLPATVALGYPFLYFCFDYWHRAQPDGWLNLPVAIALLVLAWEAEHLPEQPTLRGTLLRAAGFGSCAAAACLFKYTAIVLFVASLPLWISLGRASRRRGQVFAATAGGAFTSVLGLFAVWLWISGALAAFIDSQFNLVPEYAARPAVGSLWEIPGKMAGMFVHFRLWLPAVASLGIVPALLHRPDRDERRGLAVVILWMLGGLLACAIQRKFFPYHVLPFLPGAALAAATVVAAIPSHLRSRWGAPMLLACGLALTPSVIWLSPHVQRALVAMEVATSEQPVEEHWHLYQQSDFSALQNWHLARLLEDQTPETERIFLWGFEPAVSFMAKRKMVSRFLYNYPFAASHREDYREELVQALRRTPPAFFVVSSDDATPWCTGNLKDSRELLADFSELRAFLEGMYALEGRLGRFLVYRRRLSSATP